MRFPPVWLRSCAWVLVPLLAVVFVIVAQVNRARHVSYVTALGGAGELVVDPASPTGYAGGLRALIAPEHNNDSYAWIAQTQQMLAEGQWRVRHVDYDNAPTGREVHASSPYRWWLGFMAWLDHWFSDRPLGLGVERAALFADAVSQVLLLLITTLFVARRFGAPAAALSAVGLAAMFPLAGMFQPGQPDEFTLTVAAALGSLLPLLAVMVAKNGGNVAKATARGRGSFVVAGIAGGCGLWIDSGAQLPLLLGIFIGGLAAAWFSRREPPPLDPQAGSSSLPWRSWAIAGAATSLAAFLFEYAPSDLFSLRVEVNHPLHAVGWLAAGELLARIPAWLRPAAAPRSRGDIAILAAAAMLVLAVPALLLWRDHGGFDAFDVFSSRVSSLPGSATANNLATWIGQDGLTATVWATLLPLVFVLPAGWLLTRRQTSTKAKAALALACGPVLVAAIWACMELRWWSLLDVGLLGLIATALVSLPSHLRPSTLWATTGVLALALLPGLRLLLPPVGTNAREATTDAEVLGLIERDLAHWLSRQAGPEGAVVLAPPGLTASLCFHGGLRGLVSPYWENKDGFAVALRIVGSTSPDEAEALVRRREVTHLILPTWEPELEESVRLTGGPTDASLIALLRRMTPPRWLRPVAYQLPPVPGLEDERAVVFALVDVQDNATALSRLAEYFLEMGQLQAATQVTAGLKESFNTDVGALAARGQVASARRDAAEFAAVMQALVPHLSRGDDQDLAWDRRVNLAFVLADGGRMDLARAQLQRCAEEIDESRLRMLTTPAVYKFLFACQASGIALPDPALREVGLSLLPPAQRARLEAGR